MLWTIAVATLSLVSSSPAPAGALAATTGPADSVDVCALYTREEVAALSGDVVRAPRPSNYKMNMVTSSSCWYRTKTHSWSVKINVERGRDQEGIKELISSLKGVVSQTTSNAAKPVSGIGDEAYWGQIGPTNGSLHVVVGTDFLTVQTWGKAPGAGTLEKTKEVATIVVNRFKERYASAH